MQVSGRESVRRWRWEAGLPPRASHAEGGVGRRGYTYVFYGAATRRSSATPVVKALLSIVSSTVYRVHIVSTTSAAIRKPVAPLLRVVVGVVVALPSS